MAKQVIDLTSTGLLIGGLSWSWCKKISDGTNVSTTGATLTERGSGIYIINNPNVTEDSDFRVYVTADNTKYAVGVFSPADGILPVNILSATKGAIQVSYAKTGGTVEVVKGDTISIPYGPLGKDITGRKVYFAVKQFLSDATYKIAVKEITAQITNATTFTGTIPLISAELNLTAGSYYAEIESRAADGTSTPATELKFTLKIVEQVIG